MLFLTPKFQKIKQKKVSYFLVILILLMSFGCENNSDQILIIDDDIPVIDQKKEFKILSLGDSYTIGESVCATCRFPEQLKDSLSINFKKDTTFSLQVIARTGWTTTNLINAIEQENISDDFDLVTLLIGVNNQFQQREFSIYEKEFPELIATSIKAANDKKKNVIVVSIPDYAFTPFGRGSASISTEIDKYNEFAKNYCEQNGITFVNITDITREGLSNTGLVASDGLHPSTLAYTKFVERILPLAIEKLKD